LIGNTCSFRPEDHKRVLRTAVQQDPQLRAVILDHPGLSALRWSFVSASSKILGRFLAFISIAPLSVIALNSTSEIMAYTAKSEGGQLRTLGDAVVADVTDTHVLVVSKSAGDALYVPLLMAWKHAQLRSRASKEIKQAMDALQKAGKPLDDGWNGKNVLYVEKFSPKAHMATRNARTSNQSSASTQRNAAKPSSPNLQTITVRPAAAGDTAIDRSRNSSIAEEARIQLSRFAHDSQRNVMRMHQDAIRQHNRMVEDAQNGAEPNGARELQRFSDDSVTGMQRQAADTHLDAMRGLNDSMRNSGMGIAPIHEPAAPMHGPAFP